MLRTTQDTWWTKEKLIKSQSKFNNNILYENSSKKNLRISQIKTLLLLNIFMPKNIGKIRQEKSTNFWMKFSTFQAKIMDGLLV